MACAGPQPAHVYVSRPPEGLKRMQSKEVIPYDKSWGYYCMHGDDLENILFLLMELSQKEK